MKVAVSAAMDNLKQQVNPVFGRCPGFLIVEIEGKEIKGHSFLPNSAAQAGMGAGIAAAQTIANQGVQAVISGNIGPNAFMVLSQSGIKVYQVADMSIEQAVQQLAEGKLQEMPAASATGHFGMDAGRGREFGRGAGGRGRAGRRFGRGAGRGSSRGREFGRGRGAQGNWE